MWSSSLSFLPALPKLTGSGKAIAILVLIIAALVGYHFYDEAVDKAAYSALETKYAELNTSKEQLNTKYETLKKDQQTSLDNLAVSEQEYKNLKKKYDIDMGTCVIIKNKQEEEINRLKLNNRKLEDYIKANPNSGITTRIPDALIDIINGK